MKVLVIGSGGREHALCWKISQSPLVEKLYCCPGNAGIAAIATCLNGEATQVAEQINAEFVVVGPDGALADGLVDRLQSRGIPAFGPTKQAAQLESSKLFCKQLLRKYRIPTADFTACEDAASARAAINARPEGPLVIKADGLAVGKGVVVARSKEEALQGVDAVLGIANATLPGTGSRLLIEEMMTGNEVSFFAVTDGSSLVPLIDVQDHKRVGEGDTGPNTGGMGCYSPVPGFTAELRKRVLNTILLPTLEALKNEGINYRGVLYCGLMITPQGPKVVEFNARFGDPEAQVIMPLLQGDIMPLLLAAAGVPGYSLQETHLQWSKESAVAVVMAAHGYPGPYKKGQVITGINQAEQQGALVFQAGTATSSGELLTNGGRVLAVTALGADFASARNKCYQAVANISFDGAHYRRDIGLHASALSP